MDALVEGLMEELNCETVFTIPLFGGIPVYESVVVTWIIMAVVFLLCILLSRNLSVENPSRRQVVVETAIKGLNDFFTETVGEKGKAYIPYLSAIAIYIGIANLIGLLGFKPPTKDMNVTATLALMSIVLIEVAGIRARGTKGWLKSFAEPMPIILPINILEVFIKPLSLCMRLFGNDGSSGSFTGSIQLLLRYIRWTDTGVCFRILNWSFYKRGYRVRVYVTRINVLKRRLLLCQQF